jgi:hypothetical protein
VLHHHKELAYTVRVDKPNPVFEELGDTNQAAPNDVPDEGEYQQYAYAFFGHADAPMELMPGPESVHAGLEATRNGSGDGNVMDKVKDKLT